MENYLDILEESLYKKIDVLNRIELMNRKQEEILKASDVSMDVFDKTLDEKGELIQELTQLDSGFQQLYDRIRDNVMTHKELYSIQIKRLQQLIGEVTDKGIVVQVHEERNKKLAEKYFVTKKQEVRKSRISSKAAYNYYGGINKNAQPSSQLFDKKN